MGTTRTIWQHNGNMVDIVTDQTDVYAQPQPPDKYLKL